MNKRETHKGFVLGEAVRDKTTGQTMYVEVAWKPGVSCVYFDREKDALVKVQVLPENLERVKGILPYLPK
ncbi:hypothetical protein E4414_02200 [Leptospira interrogans]|uniref:hypothetical protein n=1 Tax=Leptospira interrogans TaxID=173 RepID=UPI0010C107B6|nr:hypothetical protein [Leptospira interrogans]QCO32041.1 hypothetical protein E4414_02200 [Leptospira interrogans]